MNWETKAERRERKKNNNRKMAVDGKDMGEFIKRANEKRRDQKRRQKRRWTD